MLRMPVNRLVHWPWSACASSSSMNSTSRSDKWLAIANRTESTTMFAGIKMSLPTYLHRMLHFFSAGTGGDAPALGHVVQYDRHVFCDFSHEKVVDAQLHDHAAAGKGGGMDGELDVAGGQAAGVGGGQEARAAGLCVDCNDCYVKCAASHRSRGQGEGREGRVHVARASCLAA